MKFKIFIVFLALLMISLSLKADWQPQTSGTTENLYSAYFINQNTGWVVGFNGKILFTSNGGLNWSSQTSGTAQTLFNVDFPSALNGFIIGSLNTFLKTTNGGLNWISLGVVNMTSTNDIDFIDNNTGYVCGADGDVSRTTNGGVNWTKFDITTNDLFEIKAIDANTVITGGVGGITYKTTNGGTNWVSQITGTNNFISGIVFADASNGYFTTLGLSEDVRRTTNGGLNWAAVTSPGNTSGLNGLALVNAPTVYGIGPAGKIRRTTNSGTSWETQPSGDTTTFLRGIFMVDGNIGYVVGNGGKILKTLNGGIGIQQISTHVPDGFSLKQNYPNPFNPVTNIEFLIPKAGLVKLSIFDISGKEIAVLVNGNLSIGTFRADFDAAEYSSGVYFYKLSSGSFTQTKKMILVK
jgi:photosystem II stability/assembly factor-like uncharacterized protein